MSSIGTFFISCLQDSRSLQQDLPIYRSWSSAEENWLSPDLDALTRTKSAACQTDWSFPPRILIKDPLLTAVSGSCSLDISNPSVNSSTMAQSPITQQSPLIYRSPVIHPSPLKSSSPQEKVSAHTERRHCVFCKQNGETKEFYFSHVLKDAKGRVVCPTLRDYVCPICGATGSLAHTISYCPLNKEKANNFRSLFSKVGEKREA